MSFPLSNVTRTTVSLARKSALLAHVSSPVPVAPNVNAQHTRALTSSGAKPSVSSLSSATFLGASLAARKLVAANGERKSLQEDPSAEVHGYLKAIIQSKQKAMDAEMANEVKEEFDPAAY